MRTHPLNCEEGLAGVGRAENGGDGGVGHVSKIGDFERGWQGGRFDFDVKSRYFSNMTKLGIAIADDEIGWAQTRIATGEFANIDAYINQLIRRDRAENEETAWLQAEIDKGRASGLINRDASEVLREVMAANRAARG
jgi:antitoxin ParD1/3/4